MTEGEARDLLNLLRGTRAQTTCVSTMFVGPCGWCAFSVGSYNTSRPFAFDRAAAWRHPCFQKQLRLAPSSVLSALSF
eukprot:1527448-Amphidinium_carterae.2